MLVFAGFIPVHFLVMGHISPLIVLLFPFPAVKDILIEASRIIRGFFLRHVAVLPVVFDTATFHNTRFRKKPKNHTTSVDSGALNRCPERRQ